MYSCPGCQRSCFPGSSAGKESACNAGDHSSIPEPGRSPGEGIGYSLQSSWVSLVAQMVKNPPAMWETWVEKIPWRKAWQPTPVFLDRGVWEAAVHGVTKSGTQLSNFHLHVTPVLTRYRILQTCENGSDAGWSLHTVKN